MNEYFWYGRISTYVIILPVQFIILQSVTYIWIHKLTILICIQQAILDFHEFVYHEISPSSSTTKTWNFTFGEFSGLSAYMCVARRPVHVYSPVTSLEHIGKSTPMVIMLSKLSYMVCIGQLTQQLWPCFEQFNSVWREWRSRLKVES